MFKVGDKWITEKDIRRIKEDKDNYDLAEYRDWETGYSIVTGKQIGRAHV